MFLYFPRVFSDAKTGNLKNRPIYCIFPVFFLTQKPEILKIDHMFLCFPRVFSDAKTGNLKNRPHVFVFSPCFF